MNKQKVKETLIDIYGLTVFITALLLTSMVLLLSVMAVLFLLDSEIIRPLMCIGISGIFILYSVKLISQIQ